MELELNSIEQVLYDRYARRASLLQKLATVVITGYVVVASGIWIFNGVSRVPNVDERLQLIAQDTVQIPLSVVQKIESRRTSNWNDDHLWILTSESADVNCSKSASNVCRYLAYSSPEQAAFIRMQLAINRNQLDEARSYLSQINLPAVYASPEYLVNPKVAYRVETTLYDKPQSAYLKEYLDKLNQQIASESAEIQEASHKWQRTKSSLFAIAGWSGLIAFLAITWSVRIRRRLERIKNMRNESEYPRRAVSHETY